MKNKPLLVLAVVLTALLLFGAPEAALAAPVEQPGVAAEAACLMLTSSKRVLYDKNKDGIMYPASTTKIVTLLTALEKGQLNDEVVVSEAAADCEESRLGLHAGDRLSLRELLYGMMLPSGNDAAVAVGEHVGHGSLEAFIAMMNEQAQRAGATRTNFTNPHGLPDPINHYTTAYDMALITTYAYGKPEFTSIVNSRTHSVIFANRGKITVSNTNRLLGRFAGANGVKTGYTREAGECLVAGAERGGVQLIAVVLNSPQRWADAARLLEYGFKTLGIQ
ncbi:D-alanyl-D-alanine carboxypeptidase family protein [Azotosporobacter soli]|uniref:D-alanyl-D-alanine carboxypeptidase family protein n=1 Tax=Azotosporobacter soli TaxID=3055040 RepID=UPI0031FE4ABF